MDGWILIAARLHIYTDGSKDQIRGAALAVFKRNTFGVCLPNQSLIFTAEAQALLLALECIEISNYTKYIVHNDSCSCLQAVAGLKTDHWFVAKIIFKMVQLAMDVNGQTDQAAKKALNCDVDPCLIPYSDLKPLITTRIKFKWQHEWDENINKLHEIEPSMSKPPQIHAGSLLSHFHIEHSWLTHAFLKHV